MTSRVDEQRTITVATGGCGRGPGGQLAALPRASRCPLPGCSAQIDPSRLMCRSHWYLVPRQIRDRVWATWRSGHQAFSPEHQQAVRMAITACQAAAMVAGRPASATARQGNELLRGVRPHTSPDAHSG